MKTIALLDLAGGAGTICRYALSHLVHDLCGQGFPWGTFTVNLIGCLVIGFLAVFLGEKISIGPQARLALFVGFLGAFTTFSSFMLDVVRQAENSVLHHALFNLLLQNGLGITAVVLGMALGRVALKAC